MLVLQGQVVLSSRSGYVVPCVSMAEVLLASVVPYYVASCALYLHLASPPIVRLALEGNNE